MTQTSQSVVCNARNPLAGRLRVGMMTRPTRRDEFELTHEFLDTCAACVAQASARSLRLQKMGFYQYRKGMSGIMTGREWKSSRRMLPCQRKMTIPSGHFRRANNAYVR